LLAPSSEVKVRNRYEPVGDRFLPDDRIVRTSADRSQAKPKLNKKA
jgi:hypothetical protein